VEVPEEPHDPRSVPLHERANQRRLKSFIRRAHPEGRPGVKDFRAVFAYNWRVLRDFGAALERLPAAEAAKDRGATYGSMKNVFHHILSVHDGWLDVTAQGASADPAMREKDFDEVSIAELRGYLEKIIAKEDAFLSKLKEKDLDRTIQPAWKERPHPVRDALAQVTL